MSARINSLDQSVDQRRQSRFIVIGGFLGAGKTAAAARLGHYVASKGLRPGLITNGEGKEQVDALTLRSEGFVVDAIQGGSAFCESHSLMAAVTRLNEIARTDVFIAEPVGTCLDLAGAVCMPLREARDEPLAVAPLSVVVDPVVGSRLLGLESGGRFSDKVAYIYRKQIEEADVLVVNKADSITASALARLKRALEQAARKAALFTVSTRQGDGLEEWFEFILRHDFSPRNLPEVDYTIHAAGEALLGWVYCNVSLSSVKYFEVGKVLSDLAISVQSALRQESAELAHLKMTFEPDDDGLAELAVLSLVRNDDIPALSQRLSEPVQSGEMIIDLRAEADPEILHAAVTRALLNLMENSRDLFARMKHSEFFRPGKSRPSQGAAGRRNRQ